MKTALIHTDSIAVVRVEDAWLPVLRNQTTGLLDLGRVGGGKYVEHWYASAESVDEIQALITEDLSEILRLGATVIILTREMKQG